MLAVLVLLSLPFVVEKSVIGTLGYVCYSESEPCSVVSNSLDPKKTLDK